MRGAGRWLLAAWMTVAAAAAQEPYTLRLQWQPGEVCTFRESFRGRGDLVRQRGETQDTLKLDATGDGLRRWTVEEVGEQGARLAAASTAGKLTLTMPGSSYADGRPWRGYRLLVSPSGQVVESALAEAVDAPEPTDPLPFDLDLSEFLVLLELGMLPPGPLRVGESWQSPAANQRLKVEGTLLRVSADAAPIAELETRWRAAIERQPTPVRDVTVDGELSGLVTLRFDLTAGRVLAARGPVELRLNYRRGQAAAVGTVLLKLDLETTRETK
ncbi:MAG: hypothetical protein IT204_16775 [Fimbriimonadaceae bacterium]|nr:hypothetical protein [Fimbriimonadaceae bacterium]